MKTHADQSYQRFAGLRFAMPRKPLNSTLSVDKNLVTAPAWPAHPVWLAKFLEVLGTRIEL